MAEFILELVLEFGHQFLREGLLDLSVGLRTSGMISLTILVIMSSWRSLMGGSYIE